MKLLKGASIFLWALLGLTQCMPNGSSSGDFTKLDSLSALLTEQSDEITSQLDLLDEIDQALDGLTAEEIKKWVDPEKLKTIDQEIFGKIDQLKRKLSADQIEINQLKDALKKAKESADYRKDLIDKIGARMEKLSQENETLRQQVRADSQNVGELTALLEAQGIEMGELKNRLREMQKSVTELSDKLNTGFYLIGNRKALKDDGIIERSGVGGSYVLREISDVSRFQTLNKMKDKSLSLTGFKKVEVVPIRPNDTYEWVKDEKLIVGLKITDPLKFWAVSDYLVVVTKGGED